MIIAIFCQINYRKVASSRPVYYSIFDHFWGATNQDVLLTETCYYCYVQKSIKWWVHKGLHEFSSIFVNLPWLALFLKISFKNVLKSFDGAFLLSCKCIFISKNWEKSDRNSWGSYILVGKVDDFWIRFDPLAWIRYGVHKYLLLLTKTCYYTANIYDQITMELQPFIVVVRWFPVEINYSAKYGGFLFKTA